MFIVSLTYHQPIDVVEALTENHKDWLKILCARRLYRLRPESTTYRRHYFSESIAREALDKILAEDPFNAVADYSVTEFVPSMAIESVEALKSL